MNKTAIKIGDVYVCKHHNMNMWLRKPFSNEQIKINKKDLLILIKIFKKNDGYNYLIFYDLKENKIISNGFENHNFNKSFLFYFRKIT